MKNTPPQIPPTEELEKLERPRTKISPLLILIAVPVGVLALMFFFSFFDKTEIELKNAKVQEIISKEEIQTTLSNITLYPGERKLGVDIHSISADNYSFFRDDPDVVNLKKNNLNVYKHPLKDLYYLDIRKENGFIYIFFNGKGTFHKKIEVQPAEGFLAVPRWSAESLLVHNISEGGGATEIYLIGPILDADPEIIRLPIVDRNLFKNRIVLSPYDVGLGLSFECLESTSSLTEPFVCTKVQVAFLDMIDGFSKEVLILDSRLGNDHLKVGFDNDNFYVFKKSKERIFKIHNNLQADFKKDNNANVPAEDLNQKVNKEGWQTYRNEEYGFQFEYPGDYVLESDGVKVKYSTGVNWYEVQFENNDMNERLVFSVEINPDGYGPIYFDKEYEIEVKADGGIKFMEHGASSDEALEDNRMIIMSSFFENNDNTYRLWFTYDEVGQDLEPIFRKILSTFRFIQP